MTTEQRKAIENLSEIVNLSKEELQKENENITAILDYEDLKSLDTVLYLIKEQQEKIENLQKELNEENKRCMVLANNDKFKEQVIELMSELVYKRFKPELLLVYGFESKEQFKQYFADLVEKE